MTFGTISASSVSRPLALIVLASTLSAAGCSRHERARRDQAAPTTVVVDIEQPGAAPTTIEKSVTQPVEAALRSVTGISAISTTVSEGRNHTLVELANDGKADIDAVKRAVVNIRGDLPANIREPKISLLAASGVRAPRGPASERQHP